MLVQPTAKAPLSPEEIFFLFEEQFTEPEDRENAFYEANLFDEAMIAQAQRIANDAGIPMAVVTVNVMYPDGPETEGADNYILSDRTVWGLEPVAKVLTAVDGERAAAIYPCREGAVKLGLMLGGGK